MKKSYIKYLPALAAAGLLAACQPELEAPAINRGGLDFTNYIAVGNSLTAGFMDNGLYREGQVNSYPNILAQQFKLAGGGAFGQPLFTEAQASGSGYQLLTGFTAPAPPLNVASPIITQVAPTAIRAVSPQPLFTKFTGPINNLGVPGIKIADIKTPGYGSTQGNPYFERITPDATPNQTYLARALASNPTFFTSWLGNNDVLSYATAGGFAGAITAPATFAANYTELVNGLTTSANTKGALATIPAVTNVPFFTTVGPTVKRLLTLQNIPAMVALTANGATRKTIAVPSIKDNTGGANLIPLTASPYLGLLGARTGKYWRDIAKTISPTAPKVALAGLLLNYQLDTTQLFGFSAGNPWPSALILDETEQSEINTATAAYNAAITSLAGSKNLALFDANAFFNDIQIGANGQPSLYINGVGQTPAYISGNLFSLDGVHPTPRGYALVANEFIKAINKKYGSTIPQVNPNNYRGIALP